MWQLSKENYHETHGSPQVQQSINQYLVVKEEVKRILL